VRSKSRRFGCSDSADYGLWAPAKVKLLYRPAARWSCLLHRALGAHRRADPWGRAAEEDGGGGVVFMLGVVVIVHSALEWGLNRRLPNAVLPRKYDDKRNIASNAYSGRRFSMTDVRIQRPLALLLAALLIPWLHGCARSTDADEASSPADSATAQSTAGTPGANASVPISNASGTT
jgi:hypothetical protein